MPIFGRVSDSAERQPEPVDVVVVGAGGFAGLYALHRLRTRGD